MPSSATTAKALITATYLVFLSCVDADESNFRFDNQSKPEVETLRYVVSEHTKNGTLVADIKADSGLRRLLPPEVVDKLYFRFLSALPVGAPMTIHRKSGIIRTAGDIDREAAKQCHSVEACRLPVDVTSGRES